MKYWATTGLGAALPALLGVVLATPANAGPAMPQAWVTSAGHAHILTPVAVTPAAVGAFATITVDPTQHFQPIDGFGFALTGGSAQLLAQMSPPARHALLVELFGRGPGSIGVSWLRISIGSSDLDDHVFTYDDLPPGDADPALRRFSLAPDERALIPVLHEILGIAPHLPVLASPWSMPGWMKTNGQPRAARYGWTWGTRSPATSSPTCAAWRLTACRSPR